MAKKQYEITALAYDKRMKLLSVGKNSYTKTHRMQAKIAQSVGLPDKIFLHAEMAALLSARGKVHTLKVFRYDSRGLPKLAKPCPVCQEAIRLFGVKNVEYTVEQEGE